MELTFPVLVGVLFGVGFYLSASRSLTHIVLGFLILSQGANLLLFASGGLKRAASPIVQEGAKSVGDSPDPLAQALILTAIVIGFAATAFLVVLVRQAAILSGTTDVGDLRSSEP